MSRFAHSVSPSFNRRQAMGLGVGATALGLIPSIAAAQSAPPDLILLEGDIWTQDALRPRANALAIVDGIVTAVGDDAEIRAMARSRTQIISAGGRRVIPGLVDSHAHPTRGGRFYSLELRWDGVGSLARGLEMIREQAGRTPDDEWVRVIGGWSPYQFAERRFPTPAELTEASPDVPVYVLFLYSQGYLNAAGVRALGLSPAAETPPGTRHEFTEDGGAVIHAEPNPNLLYSTIDALPPMNAADQALSTRHFYRELARFGLTSVIDAGGGGHNFPADYAGTQALADAGEMPIRISNYLFPQRPGNELEDFERWTRDFAQNVDLAKQLSEGFVVEGGGEFLVWSAGDFENFMAARPELTEREGYAEELLAATRHLLQARWPIRIHGTYDESIRLILDVFERADRLEREAGRGGFRGVRWAIDHAETIQPDTLDRVAAMGGGVASQARMAYSGELFADRYGSDMAGSAPPIADIIARGIPLGLGTDATRVASYNPWNALDFYVTGRTVGGTALLDQRHRQSRAEALWRYTVGSAWFSGEEARKGRLAPGQFADFAVLDRDYFSIADDELSEIEALLTVTGGKISYGSEEFATLAPELPLIAPSWSPVRVFGGYQN